MNPLIKLVSILPLLWGISYAQESYKNENLQKSLSLIASKSMHELDAKRVAIAVMNSVNGEILAMADTDADNILDFTFEPGSVIMPITYVLALENNKVTADEKINGHNGKYVILDKYITDEIGHDLLTPQEIIRFSSNIGIAQIGQRLDGIDFYVGLNKFGFGQYSMPEELNEERGVVSNSIKLNHEIYKATTSYGYGIIVNFMQLIQAYSTFNNDGKMVMPSMHTPSNKHIQVVKPQNANEVKQILIASTKDFYLDQKGLEIGGKTGNAHMVENKQYVAKYITSFVGFANSEKEKYTIGVLVVEHKKEIRAFKTSVPLFQKSVEMLMQKHYLKH